MGFLIGCYSAVSRSQESECAIEQMASFFLELGFVCKRLQFSPQCSIGWLSKEGASVPATETQSGIYFGEVDLYNRRQLEAKLHHHEREGSTSDLELVGNFVDVFGPAAIRYVNGDFVLGQLDRNTGRLRFFRDHFGVRSLYHLAGAGIACFSSIVAALLRLRDAPSEPDIRSLGMFLLLGAPMLDRTYYPGMRALPPSSYMVLNGNGCADVTKYWSPSPGTFAAGLPQDQVVSAFEELLVESIESRLSKKGKTAIQLSGGLDSSTIAAIACCRHPDKIFPSVTTILPDGYSGPEKDEKAYVDALAQRYPNLEPHFEDGLGTDPLRIPTDPLLLCGPSGNAFEYMENCLRHRAASQKAEVLLSGLGGDDCVSGNAPSYLVEALSKLRFGLARLEVLRLRRDGNDLASVAKRYIAMPLLPLTLLRWRWKLIGSDWTKYTSLSARAFEDLGLIQNLQEYGQDSALQLGRTVSQNEARDLSLYLKDGGLLSSDSMEIRTAIQTRYPLLDTALLEAALSVPFEFKKNRSEERALLRAASRGYLPTQIAERTDKGSANPHFRKRLASCEKRLRVAFSEFGSNEVWRYLVDTNKIESALARLRQPSLSSEVIVALMKQVCQPYELGCFLKKVNSCASKACQAASSRGTTSIRL
jgi:asparagine synthase (glutamine-hydrolysing)